jgi:hypothetical protein
MRTGKQKAGNSLEFPAFCTSVAPVRPDGLQVDGNTVAPTAMIMQYFFSIIHGPQTTVRG